MEVVSQELTMSNRGGSKLWVHDRFVVSLITTYPNLIYISLKGQDGGLQCCLDVVNNVS